MTRPLVCRTADVPENGLKECAVEGGMKLVVANAGGEFFAYQATCPHQDVALCEGLFDGSTLTCHMHLWQWDIRTGAPLGIAEAPLQRYPLAREDDALYLGAASTALDVAELFNGIGETALEALGKLARREEFAAASVIYRLGDPSDNFFVLQSGPGEFQIGRDRCGKPGGFRLRQG